MIRTINYQHTPTSFPGVTGMFRIIYICVPGGIWLSQWHFKCLAGRGSVCLQISQMCTFYERNRVSAWSAHVFGACHRSAWSVWSADDTKIQDHSDPPVGSVKYGYPTLVGLMFSRGGSVWGRYFSVGFMCGICVICTSIPCWICMIRRIYMYDLPKWSMFDLNDLCIFTETRCVRFAGSVWSAGVPYEKCGASVKAGYITLVSACMCGKQQEQQDKQPHGTGKNRISVAARKATCASNSSSSSSSYTAIVCNGSSGSNNRTCSRMISKARDTGTF